MAKNTNIFNVMILFLTIFLASCSNKKLDYEVNLNRDSTIKSDGFTLNGKKHGYWRYYHSNGFIFKEGLYINDQRWGMWNYRYTNGNMKYNVTFKNDTIDGKVYEFRKNKVSKMITFRKNIINGNELLFVYDSLSESIVDTFFSYNPPGGSIGFENAFDVNEPDFPLATVKNFLEKYDWMSAAEKGKQGQQNEKSDIYKVMI